MHIAIIGANGFIGTNFISAVLKNTDWNITACVRTIPINPPFVDKRLRYCTVDLLQPDSFDSTAFESIDCVYYFVHMMNSQQRNYDVLERESAMNFKTFINTTNVSRVVFLGGLGRDTETLSKHLKSRHDSGRIVRSSNPSVIELRASMIIGRGSVGFDIITTAAERMPFMVFPVAAKTKTQPTALEDLLLILLKSAKVPLTTHDVVVEIGGHDIVTYADLFIYITQLLSKHTQYVTLPYIPRFLMALYLDAMRPAKQAKTGTEMIDSMSNEMIVTDDSMRQLFPDLRPKSIKEAISAAIS